MTIAGNDMDSSPSRVLSGVQPSGALHLGNYYGAIKQHIELQHEYPGEAFYFIANYHALTTIRDGDALRRQSWNVALDYLALGLDPAKATFYRQSDVPQVCELMWLLSCVTGKGLLERAHAYKEKVAQGVQPSVGLFVYPVLMAADILSVRATAVPVGIDQEQHLEMTRDMARSFNAAFQAQVFPLPASKFALPTNVPGIDGRKMSKSYQNEIPIFAGENELEEKVKAIKTSSAPLGTSIDPESDTVFALYRLVATPEQQAELREQYVAGQVSYQQAKVDLLTSLREFFAPARAKRAEFEKDLDAVEDILRDGAERARGQVAETVELVRGVTGLSQYRRNPSWGG